MSRKGKIQTVTGLIEPEKLGVTMTHEHLWLDSRGFFIAPAEKHKEKIDMPFKLENFGWIMRNPYSHRPNLGYGAGDKDTILEEMKYYKSNGGCSIVENTTVGLHPNVPYLKQLSEESGVNIVVGTGFYVGSYQSESGKAISSEDMVSRMKHDLIEGVRDTGIKCGVIGEVGGSWPLDAFEKRSFRSTAQVQSELGCPVIMHPGRHPDAPFEIMRIFCEAGGKVDNVVMSHLDRTFFDTATLLDFASLGAYCEYDLFGMEVSHYTLGASVDMPSDAQKIQYVKALVDNEFGDRICVSHDIYTKHRLMKYGGHGFSHILENIVPKMLDRGISKEAVDKIIVDNPKRWLTYQM